MVIKMNKKVLLLATISIICFLLCSCQSNPVKQTVISKNGGINKHNTQASDEKQTDNLPATEDVFFSSDGTVEFHFTVEGELIPSDLPIYEVVPHYLTGEDVKRSAEALFGDVEFQEAPPEFDTVYTKNEIRDRIARWAPYTSEEAVYELFGEERDTSEIVKSFITDYSKKLESAPNEKEEIPCQWTFKKESYYYDAAEKVATMDTSKDDDMIQATVAVNDIKYAFQAKTRNKKDYKLNYISAFLDDGISPDGIDKRIFRAKLCRTPKPTEEQMVLAQRKAEKILEEIDLGKWKIDQCNLQTDYIGDTPEYTIYISAVPAFDGIAAARYPQLEAYGAKNDSYASNYFLSDVYFEFSANGDLLRFRMYSPIELYNVTENSLPVLGYSELVEIAKKQLSLSDYYQYDRDLIIDYIDEGINCTVDICEWEYNISRVKVPNTDDHYYYIPSLRFKGNIQMSGKQTGDVYYATDTPETLLTLNAMDGSIINTTTQ